MGIKIKMIREGEPHHVRSERVRSESCHTVYKSSDLISDPEELKLRRTLQQLKAELRQQELETIKRKYLGEH